MIRMQRYGIYKSPYWGKGYQMQWCLWFRSPKERQTLKQIIDMHRDFPGITYRQIEKFFETDHYYTSEMRDLANAWDRLHRDHIKFYEEYDRKQNENQC